MTLVTAAILIALALVAGSAYRRRRERFLGIVAALATVVLLIGLLLGARPTADLRPIDYVLLAIAALIAIDTTGLPESWAVRLGLGFRSREWDFDRKLTGLLRPINELLAQQPDMGDTVAYGAWRERLLREAERRLAGLRRLSAPSPAWQELADSYVEIYSRIREIYRRGEAEPERRDIEARSRAADEERRILRRQYRLAAAALLGRSRVGRRLRGAGPGQIGEDGDPGEAEGEPSRPSIERRGT